MDQFVFGASSCLPLQPHLADRLVPIILLYLLHDGDGSPVSVIGLGYFILQSHLRDIPFSPDLFVLAIALFNLWMVTLPGANSYVASNGTIIANCILVISILVVGKALLTKWLVGMITSPLSAFYLSLTIEKVII